MTGQTWTERKAEILAKHRAEDDCPQCPPPPDCDSCDEPITGVPLSDANDDFWQRTRRVFCSVDCHQNYAERQMQP